MSLGVHRQITGTGPTDLLPMLTLKLQPPSPQISVILVRIDSSTQPQSRLLDLALGPEQSTDRANDDRVLARLFDGIDRLSLSTGTGLHPDGHVPQVLACPALPARSSTLIDSAQSSSLLGFCIRAFSSSARALIVMPAFSSNRDDRIQSGIDLGQALTPLLYASRAPGMLSLSSLICPFIMYSLSKWLNLTIASSSVLIASSGLPSWRSK
jgi:hypothetical protein